MTPIGVHIDSKTFEQIRTYIAGLKSKEIKLLAMEDYYFETTGYIDLQAVIYNICWKSGIMPLQHQKTILQLINDAMGLDLAVTSFNKQSDAADYVQL